jgi:hypothetical protein
MMAPTEPRLLDAEDDGEPEPGEHVLRVLDREHGDKRIKWKPGDAKSIERAKARFEKLQKEGYAFFRLNHIRVAEFPSDSTTKMIVGTSDPAKVALIREATPEGPIRHFEPDADEVHGVPARRGG